MALAPSLIRALVGQSELHLCTPAEGELLGARLHRDVVSPFLELRFSARLAGFELALSSGFRDFARQLSIWNRKVDGDLAVLDSHGVPLDITTLTPIQLVRAILRWSALPGASRHHWGTDVDVFDKAATPEGYDIQLIPAEVDPGGMHAPLHAWLDARIADGAAYGFFRPYDAERGGIAPERWHLSHAPTAVDFAERLTPELLHDTLAPTDMRLRDVVLDHLPELFERFVINTNPAHR
jgi:LAS superfamily LD-carboxypeptidase LdcB